MKLLPPLPVAVKVWIFRTRAVAWLAIGVWSFMSGNEDSVMLVWIASLYANIATDLGGAAAADDRTVLNELKALRLEIAALHDQRPPSEEGMPGAHS